LAQDVEVERWDGARAASEADSAGMRARWGLKTSPTVFTVPVSDELGRVSDLYFARDKKHVYFAVWARFNRWQMDTRGPQGTWPALSGGGKSVRLDRLTGRGITYWAEPGTPFPTSSASPYTPIVCTSSSSRYGSQVSCYGGSVASEMKCTSSGWRTNCASVTYEPVRSTPGSVPRNEPVTFRLDAEVFSAIAADPGAQLLLGDSPIPLDSARDIKLTPVNTVTAVYRVNYQAAFAAVMTSRQ
jgi:hypothetical protein